LLDGAGKRRQGWQTGLVTPDQIIKSLRIDDGQHRRLTRSVMNAPVIQRAMKDARFGVLNAQLRERLQQQIDFQKLIRPGLLEQMRKQNAIFLESPGVKRLVASVDFKIPEGLADQLAAYGDQLAAEIADPDTAMERAKRLAEEREAIIQSLRLVSVAMEGFAYLPESPIPPFVAYLFVLLLALSEAANRVLIEREDDE